jgi:hypothetical protein
LFSERRSAYFEFEYVNKSHAEAFKA